MHYFYSVDDGVDNESKSINEVLFTIYIKGHSQGIF